MWMQRCKRFLAVITSLAILGSGLVATHAQAGVVSTAEVIQSEQLDYDRSQLKALLDGDEVAQKMAALGVERAEIDARIDALTASELAELNAQIADMPAGAGVLGLLVLIFIVFVITDVIGATDIFPFIHPVR